MAGVEYSSSGPVPPGWRRPAARRGARVPVLDAADQPGGQYWRHLPQRGAGHEQRLHHGWRRYRQLRAASALTRADGG